MLNIFANSMLTATRQQTWNALPHWRMDSPDEPDKTRVKPRETADLRRWYARLGF